MKSSSPAILNPMSDFKAQTAFSRTPPFKVLSAVPQAIGSGYPSSFWTHKAPYLLDPQDTPQSFLEHDLLAPKLDALHERLWLAGLVRQARPLHRQKLLQRTIRITESADEHLVWHKDNIFIKPMPGYLLDHEHWTEFLCSNEKFFASATGLLLSYVWLVASTTDYAIAIEERIFPPWVTWEIWRDVVRDIVRSIDVITAQVDRRYYYGELRLSRLNTLYRFNPSTFSPRNFVDGFMPTPTWYTQFFEKNFSWILAAFIYITVVLSAMQVGLATSHLQDNTLFQDISYGVAVTAIIIVVVVVVLILAVWVVLFWFHLCSTIRHSKKEMVKRCESQRISD